jgi:biopolymer transport protein ExbD
MARIRKKAAESELDVTSFMNLMIVLVPVLLLNMTIASTTVLDIKLPQGAGDSADDPQENRQIEVIIRPEHMALNYPAGVLMAQFPKVNGEYDFKGLSEKLQQMKPVLESSIGESKKDILILSEEKTDYQTLVTTMDTVRSYEIVMITSVVNAELFPDISLGDAPILEGADASGGAL